MLVEMQCVCGLGPTRTPTSCPGPTNYGGSDAVLLLAKSNLHGPCAMPLETLECWGEVQAEECYAARHAL